MVVVLSSFRCPSPAGCLLSRPQDQADATGLSLISTQLFRHCQLPVPWILFFHVWIIYLQSAHWRVSVVPVSQPSHKTIQQSSD
ncbi:hypothetical protein MPTK1_4g06480 [Marchantia polymorpha subsp. ruderalis]|uniref:Uncharacterized protein n=2 Tax=Marchantia polymorpha TaxID=3197 RepID=A0AAF6B712_MARPO|nr:hypothetical protein MARPO_0114s0006 [Marchantia polymorpha]BBN07796.1 hypothetical protein Mp_4g06480 [Marchantia polymorpha subsp. ruderalis]|eukprot:PTQ31180.1 hypothetical protein MARPO_0114s0006 [Marchantia polymorpha]